MPKTAPRSARARTAARIALGSALVLAGVAHLTVAREGFQGQVPRALTDLLPFGKDDVVLMSGIVEMGLGGALILLPRERHRIGIIAASFFTAIYPGNISQLVRHDDSLGLDSDRKRAVRLLGQPLLVAWALWSTDVV